MPAPNVTIREIAIASGAVSSPGVYAGLVVPAKKGPVNVPQLCINDITFLKKFTPNEKVEVGMDTSHFSALAVLVKTEKLWVTRAANNPLFGGLVVRESNCPEGDAIGIGYGLSDPTAFDFETDPETFVVDTVTDSLTVSNNWVTGTAVQLETTDVLPAPLAPATTYFVIRVNATTIKLATTYTNALAGTAINITDAGSGTHSIEQRSMDDCLLIYGANEGEWNNDIYVMITPYDGNELEVREPNAFLIKVFKGSNLQYPVEKWTCSRVPGAKDGYERNIYVEEVLQGSNYIRAIDNTAIPSNILPKQVAVPRALSGGDDGGPVTDSHMISALKALMETEEYPLTCVGDGGWTTPAFQSEIAIQCEKRKIVGILSTPYSAEAAELFLDEIVEYRQLTFNVNSSFVAMYSPHVKIYDRFNDRDLFVAPDGYVMANISQTAYNYELWYPVGGFRRGILSVLDVRRRFKRYEMDMIYDNGINPIRFIPGRGILIWGQKTMDPRPSPLMWLNTRLLLTRIEPELTELFEENFQFEINDDATRHLAEILVSQYLDGILSRRGITDYKVQCDDNNNTPSDIDLGKMNVWIFIKPIMGVHDIEITLVVTPHAVDFSVDQQQISALGYTT